MLTIVKHPLIEVKLDLMRDARTGSKEFRESLEMIASLMCYEVFYDLETCRANDRLQTPTGVAFRPARLARNIVLAPILRAGLGMVEGVRNIIPDAKIGHIGLFRDEKTLEPSEYYCKLPLVNDPLLVIVDPMLATGGSAIAAIAACQKRGYRDIRLMCLIGVNEGVAAVEKAFPEVRIYLAALDSKLNSQGYILPGLGDAGDRIFGTD